MTCSRLEHFFGGPARSPESALTRREMGLAATVQIVMEEAIVRMKRHVHGETGECNLCLAGGVALNCVANGKLMHDGPFERLWIQPAAGDAGGAVGAALMAWYHYRGEERTPSCPDARAGTFLGPSFSKERLSRTKMPVTGCPNAWRNCWPRARCSDGFRGAWSWAHVRSEGAPS